MSALGQKRTFAHSFDHLVGRGEQRLRNDQAERPPLWDVDTEIDLARLEREYSDLRM
jgi:hypothetical protein